MRRPTSFSLNRSHPLAQGLTVAWLGEAHCSTWPIQFDSSGNGYHGTPGATGNPGNAVYWPELGRRGYASTSGNPGYYSTPTLRLGGTMAISMSLWYRQAYSTNRTGILAEISTNFNSQTGAFVLSMDTDKCYLARKCTGFYFDRRTTEDLYGTGKWTHVAFDLNAERSSASVYEGRIYINGKESVYGTTSYSANHFDEDFNDFPLYAMRRGDGSLANYGDIADVMLWTRSLTDSEIALLANRGDPMLGGFILPPLPTRLITTAASPANRAPLFAIAQQEFMPAIGPRSS